MTKTQAATILFHRWKIAQNTGDRLRVSQDFAEQCCTFRLLQFNNMGYELTSRTFIMLAEMGGAVDKRG